MQNIHATTVDFNGHGLLILGKSGSGKSDLALRLICEKGAVLVADDRTDLQIFENTLFASCAENLSGLLEVRGVGLIRLNTKEKTPVKLVIQLSKPEEIERMPSASFFNYENLKLPLLKLNAFEISAVHKIVVKLNCILEEEKEKS